MTPAHNPDDRMYMLGGMSDTASNRITFERDSQYRITCVSHTPTGSGLN